MSALQWALLILSAVVIVAIVVMSRREKQKLKNWAPPAGLPPTVPKPPAPGEQSDFFSAGHAQFDEFGVGKPRRRVAPSNEDGLFGAEPAEPPARDDSGVTPAFVRSLEKPAAPEVPDKIIVLLIAEKEGAAIVGSKLHQALSAQGLFYGAKQIYHRLSGDEKSVFSVASLLKPGTLNPTEAQGFSTPGLSIFMVLPGPVKPQAALQDMIATAQALARSLNAEVFDSKKQILTPESQRALEADVKEWARAAQL